MSREEIDELRYSCWEAKELVPDDIPIDVGDRIILCFVSVKKVDGKSRIIRYLHYAKDGAVYMRRGTTARLQFFQRLGDDCTLDRTFYLNCLYELRRGYDSCRWPQWANPGMQFVAIRHAEKSAPWIAVFYPGTKEEKRFVVNRPDLDDVIRLGVVPTGFCASRISSRKNIPQAEYSFPKRKAEPERVEKAKALSKLAKETFGSKGIEKRAAERDMVTKGFPGRTHLSGPARKVLTAAGLTERDINGPHPLDRVAKIPCLICGTVVPSKKERWHWNTKECQLACLRAAFQKPETEK